MCINVSVCVLAYQEENNISKIINTLLSQSIFENNAVCVKIYIVANGCTDNTLSNAKNYVKLNGIEERFDFFEIKDKGKANAWNKFVHEICPGNTDYVVFCDADIRIIDDTVIDSMVSMLEHEINLFAVNSKAIKDINFDIKPKNMVENFIAKSSGDFSDWKNSICGQLYGVRYELIKKLHLPIGLPVEDGFIAAAIVTNNFNNLSDQKRITGFHNIWHVYESEKKLKDIIKHQTRIVVGSSINYALFDLFSRLNLKEREELAKTYTLDKEWLRVALTDFYPKYYGWIPISFLTKRTRKLLRNKLTMSNCIKIIIGFVFDFLVYFRAQYVMFKGNGSGYW